VFPGLVRYDEVFGPNPIKHAFRVAVRRSNGYVWPASHEAGHTDGAPPMGMRLRLKASVDISGYPPEIQKIFQAMKTYGLIVADNGGNLYVTGTMDQRWNSRVLNNTFHSLRATDFEVIQLGWANRRSNAVRAVVTVAILFVCLLLQGCAPGAVGKLHTQFGLVTGHNFGEQPQQYSSTRGVAELGFVPGGLKTDTPRWSFGGTAYTLIEDNLKPGIKAMARRRVNRNVSLDFSAGPMITYDSSGPFNGFTAGVALNVSFVSLRSEYVSWPFDPWDEYHYPEGHPEGVAEHHASGHEQVWFNGLAFNGGRELVGAGGGHRLIIIAGSQGGFE
jgi:hypothetical protein